MDAAPPPTIVAEPETPVRSAAEPDEPPRARAVDLGFATFLKSGVADSGVTGISLFVTDDLGRDTFVRIAALVGQAPASGLHLTWLVGRLDTCWANGGNYAVGSGLRFDLCGGADAGATFIPSTTANAPQTLPFIDVGPSFDLRAELGPNAAFLLRTGAGINVARDSFVDSTGASFQPPLLTLDVEVAISWTLSSSRPRRALAASAR